MTVAWSLNTDLPVAHTCDACTRYGLCKYDATENAWLCEDHYRHPNASDMILNTLMISSAKTSEQHHNNDEIMSNEQGGKQSKLEYSFELLEPMMLKRVAHVLYTGKQKYGAKNWRNIPDHQEHIGRAMYHLTQALENIDHSEDHLANAVCRIMFAMWTQGHDHLRG